MENIKELLNSEIFVLFLIISIGKLLEQIKIKGFSLGIVSIFFIGAVFGYYDFVISKNLQIFGLSLFIYCIGIEAGPQFFSSFNKKAFSWGSITFLHYFLTFLFVGSVYILLFSDFDIGSVVGLYTSSIVSSIGIATVLDKIPDNSLAITFGIIYPFTLIGSLYLIPYLPVIFKQDIKKIVADFNAKEEEENRKRLRITKTFRITNPNIIGKTFEELKKFSLGDIVFSSYIENGETCLPENNIQLKSNSFIGAVGTREQLTTLEMLIGKEEEIEINNQEKLVMKRLIVSNHKIAGKKLHSLRLEEKYNIRILSIVRGKTDLSPSYDRYLLLGDRIVVVGPPQIMEQLTDLLGDDLERIFKTQFAPISLGIALGFIIGKIPIPYLNYSLGITGGILLLAMYLGYKIKIAGILWQIPRNTSAFIKQLGIYIFFAVLGVNAGKDLFTAFSDKFSILLVLSGILFSFLPVLIIYLLYVKIKKQNPLEIMGILAGNLNLTSSLQLINEKYETDLSNPAFAFAFPLGLIFSIMSSQFFYFMLVLLK